MRNFLKSFDKWVGLAAESDVEVAVLGARYLELRRQIPWLYGMLVALLTGLVIASWSSSIAVAMPSLALASILIVRSFVWIRAPVANLSAAAVQRAMRTTLLVVTLFWVFLSSWTFYVYSRLALDERTDIAFLAILVALGSSYALSRFPLTSRLPLMLLALPFAFVLAGTPKHIHAGVAVFLLILVSVRLLKAENHNFEGLVRSYFALKAEKMRAVAAEQTAVAEKARVATMANTDPLTGLVNRRGFLSELDGMGVSERRQVGLILLDLDGFKPINDTFGHATGDSMLIEVSRRLRSLGEDSVVARLGGDEFAIVCKCGSSGQAMLVAQHAIAILGRPFLLDGNVMRISACAGISFQSEADVAEALRRADLALYHAKEKGRGTFALFSPELQREVQRRTTIEQALRDPNLASDLELAFQPIFDLESMHLTAFEALARWRHAELGWVSPAEFIPITERISVLGEITDELLRRAAAEASRWPEPVRLSFNLSPVQLCSPGMAQKVLAIVKREGLAATRLQIEVTETALLADLDRARANLGKLRDHGVGIVLDDFGAGYSSVRYLREIRFDCVKLDGALIASVPGEGTDLLKGVLALCRALGQDCVAEHLETDAQLALVRELGCKYGQGFGLAPPVDATATLDLIRIYRPTDLAAAPSRQVALRR